MGSPITYVAPPPPSPAPPTSSFTPPDCGKGGGQCLVPGTYGNISLDGNTTLTLAPGVYNINSLSMAGNASVIITPLGQVVINVAGGGVTGTNPVLSLNGNSVNNLTYNANQFLINYSGSGNVNVSGNPNSSYFVLNAPNAAVQVGGNGHIFGAIVGKSINVNGNGAFSYDKNVNLAPPSTGALQLISFRHIPY
jgi:hypothetical protein